MYSRAVYRSELVPQAQCLLVLMPRGLVPTLQYDSKPLYKSTIILEFLEDAQPEHGPKLPANPQSRAEAPTRRAGIGGGSGWLPLRKEEASKNLQSSNIDLVPCETEADHFACAVRTTPLVAS